jgi:hypothetical protein
MSAMTAEKTSFKLGRLARSHNKNIPMLHTLLEGQPLAPVPAAVDYTTNMPSELGVMRNDKLGDCTCAAFYHAIQVWSFNSEHQLETEPDLDVVELYEQACGYNPNQGGEGPGGNEQHVLTYILRQGAPFGPKGNQRHKITAFAEVDVKNIDNVKRAIYEHGVAYIGFNVPQFIMPPNAAPIPVWDVDPSGDNTIIGGHAVVLAGYNASGARLISWGQYYTMTWAFFEKFVDETYAITDPLWTKTTSKVPAKLLEQYMVKLREAK